MNGMVWCVVCVSAFMLSATGSWGGGATVEVMEVAGGNGAKYRITIDTSETPDLTEWSHARLAPVVGAWYPKIVEMLPGTMIVPRKGYVAPGEVTITFTKGLIGRFIAATDGNHIYCAGNWFRQTLDGEAIGSVVHEMVHVVQQYRLAGLNNPKAAPVQGWLTEGIADYIRWYLYEPQSPGGEIAKEDLPKVRYDSQYRISANFLNWVVKTYDKDLIAKLNATIRDGNYSEALWKQYTGHSVDELNTEWKSSLARKL